MNEDHKDSDDWPLASALLVTAGFTLGLIAFAHICARIGDFFKQ